MKNVSQLFIVALLVAPVLIGCGSTDPVQVTDAQNLNAQVEGLGDAAGDEASFAKAFVAGAAPENRKDYGARGFQVVGDATVDGDSATVPVKIFGGVYSTTGKDGGSKKPSDATETEQVWTLQRNGDTWKIKDAPLG
ncbi:hypothetical protein CA51_49540 [Rosistilla oblonga]|uniref:DUF4878 domain-containing protein n=2 Tax=Rosistilla TaxID=2795779 RepID=A0A518IUP4_9BACT|nr:MULTISPECIES: hypothetical protein [Rosistilla]QDS90877.1 hypothetical protein EC9_50950 [Rosistilla ulvae]QDV15043.1 hypothetical protein CA51_49540 [Rosistilla oblonga]QDV56811.1 hypothetical protein Mal33_28110 [Rosistilla oblonga]